MALIENLEKVTQLLRRREIISEEQVGKIRKSAVSPSRKKGVSNKAKKRSAIETIESLKLDLGNKKKLDEEKIMRTIAEEYKLEFRKIDPLDLDAEVVTGLLPKPFALKHLVVPLYRNGERLTVSVIDPEDHDVIEKVAMVTGLKIDRMISTKTDIEKIIRQFYSIRSTLDKAEKDVAIKETDVGNLEQLSKLKTEEEIEESDKHIQSSVDYILRNALAQRASDIHIEPKRERSLIKMRIDGVLLETQNIPIAVHPAIVSRIKMLARLDISEKRRPQDGRIKIKEKDQEVEMRVSILPVAFGEKAVIRIFDAEMGFKPLEKLGFYPEELKRYKRFLGRPHGIILVTGPTGSGKTSTLYSSLKHIYTPQKNLVTIEDPIEIVVPEYNQVAVHAAIDLTFASALRAILRQDPDVIMIGEIRDKETAENAVQAALTGHLVLSTLHTNDTASSLTRLYDIGIEPYLIKSTLIGIAAQRLLRIICTDCAVEANYSSSALAAAGLKQTDKLKLKKGKGCEKCRHTGYFGRTAVQEVLEVTEDLRKLIDGETPAEKIKEFALGRGMKTLRENAIKKVVEGLTTPEEAVRLFSDI